MEGMVGTGPVGQPALTDEALLAGLRAGDAASFEQLVRTWCGRMLAVARRLTGREEDAQDCVQEAFLTAYQKVSGFEGRSSLGTWLHRIVVNAALTKLRSRSRRPEESLDALLPRFDATGHRAENPKRPAVAAEDALVREEVREAVRRAVDRLPEPYRTVLVLRDVEGYDTAEAARLLDLTETALKVRLHRARAALKKLLEPFLEDLQ